MEDTRVIQDIDIVIAKCEVQALDLRSDKVEHLTVFVQLTADEQDAKPIVERALRKMGFSYCGMDDVETTSVIFNGDGLYALGKEQDKKSLRTTE
jgi:hypothetical protein